MNEPFSATSLDQSPQYVANSISSIIEIELVQGDDAVDRVETQGRLQFLVLDLIWKPVFSVVESLLMHLWFDECQTSDASSFEICIDLGLVFRTLTELGRTVMVITK